MTETIFKICKKHGELTQAMTRPETTKQGYIFYRCYFCKLEKNRRYTQKHKVKLCEKNKIYKKNNRDIVNAWSKQDRLNDPEKYKAWSKIGRERAGELRSIKEISRIRGLSLDQYYELVGKHGNKCAICKLEETRKSRKLGNIARLCIDHCHKTLNVRGLLCHACNTALGKFKDDINLLKKAILYLEEHEHKN